MMTNIGRKCESVKRRSECNLMNNRLVVMRGGQRLIPMDVAFQAFGFAVRFFRALFWMGLWGEKIFRSQMLDAVFGKRTFTGNGP